VFVALLAYDSVRVLIWLDHMGLRVATLVNLSFLGMDKLEERLSRFLAPAATARCIPEAVKRFTTWAPLLIPFYIPRGQDWDKAWDRSHEMVQRGAEGGYLSRVLSWPPAEQVLLLAAAVVVTTAIFSALRLLVAAGFSRRGLKPAATGGPYELANDVYEVVAKANGEVFS